MSGTRHGWAYEPPGRALLRSLRRWWRTVGGPDPWDDDTDHAVREADSVPVCRHCLTPCSDPVWFCPACGRSFGPYNNTMPFLYIFSIGEAMRAGVNRQTRWTPFTRLGFILLGLAEYVLLAPVYFYRMYRARHPGSSSGRGARAEALPADMPYAERVTRYTTEELEDVARHIDRAQHPQRFDLVTAELARRLDRRSDA